MRAETHVVTIVGARPQFIKAAAVSKAIAATPGLRETIVHTGQHYDPQLSSVFFDELRIPPPGRNLEIGSGPHGAQTGAMLAAIEATLVELSPDFVLVYGDTNSTLAGALAASKLHIAVAHVEAGLRSFNRRMPEEVNRVVTDHLSTLLFCPTHASVAHLAAEGIRNGVHHVGDVMFDLSRELGPHADAASVLRNDPRTRRPYLAATIHRAENTDDPQRLSAIFAALRRLAETYAVLLPLHPRTRAAIERAAVSMDGLTILPPLGFLDMAYLLRHAEVVVTDSGGVQKEAYFHGRPCVTIRSETEWVETVEAGWNRLASPSDSECIVASVEKARTSTDRKAIPEYGTGRAAEAIVAQLHRS